MYHATMSLHPILRTTLAVSAAAVTILLVQWGSSAQSKPMMSVYKTATCGCCGKWVEHMKAEGFVLTVQDVDDINAVKEKLGVKPELSSCHTSVVNGYVIEGHVPAAAVHRLLKERPRVAGIAVPGMPAGSPGMEVPSGHRDPYAILTFDKSGQTAVYERR
jgi:hypothetical protein